MTDTLTLDVDNKLLLRLRERAAQRGTTPESEAIAILQQAVSTASESKLGLGTRISSRFTDIGFDHQVEELRGDYIRPIDFGPEE